MPSRGHQLDSFLCGLDRDISALYASWTADHNVSACGDVKRTIILQKGLRLGGVRAGQLDGTATLLRSLHLRQDLDCMGIGIRVDELAVTCAQEDKVSERMPLLRRLLWVIARSSLTAGLDVANGSRDSTGILDNR